MIGLDDDATARCALVAGGRMATYLGPMNYVASGASAIVVSSLFNGLEVRPACLHARLSTAGTVGAAHA